MIPVFSKVAAKNPREPAVLDFTAAILRERPDIRIKLRTGKVMVETLESGANAHILAIGNEIFKAPKLEQDIAAFQQELRTQQDLGNSGIPLPRVKTVGFDAVFYSMERVPGVTLHQARGTLTPEQKEILARDLADVLIRVAKALPMKYGRYAHHADLHSENIMIDPVTKKLTGILDFGKIDYVTKDSLGAIGLGTEMNKLVKAEYERRKSEIPDAPSSGKVIPFSP